MTVKCAVTDPLSFSHRASLRLLMVSDARLRIGTLMLHRRVARLLCYKVSSILILGQNVIMFTSQAGIGLPKQLTVITIFHSLPRLFST